MKQKVKNEHRIWKPVPFLQCPYVLPCFIHIAALCVCCECACVVNSFVVSEVPARAGSNRVRCLHPRRELDHCPVFMTGVPLCASRWRSLLNCQEGVGWWLGWGGGVLRVTVHQDECVEMGDVTNWWRCECMPMRESFAPFPSCSCSPPHSCRSRIGKHVPHLNILNYDAFMSNEKFLVR